MTSLTESVLLESKSARDEQLTEFSHDRAGEILNRVKSLYFALWQGVGIATTQQAAEFYEVPEANIRKAIERHRVELESDGLRKVTGKQLKGLRELDSDAVSLTPNTHHLTIHTPRSMLRLGMILDSSEVASAVRTSLLDAVEKVIPFQAQDLERLKLELQLAQTQERLLLTTQAIATMHGREMVALILGKPDAVITRTEKVETLVTVDERGRAIAKYDGIGITYLARRFGFGGNTKACRHWLETIGVSESQWLSEPSLVKAQKLPREILPWLDRQYASRQGTRQGLLGE
jgi:hypothetical protein